MPFKKGKEKSGGRQKGTKNQSTLVFENILSENKAELLSIAIEMAKNGNERILIKLLDKILPNLNAIEQTNSNPKQEIVISVRSN